MYLKFCSNPFRFHVAFAIWLGFPIIRTQGIWDTFICLLLQNTTIFHLFNGALRWNGQMNLISRQEQLSNSSTHAEGDAICHLIVCLAHSFQSAKVVTRNGSQDKPYATTMHSTRGTNRAIKQAIKAFKLFSWHFMEDGRMYPEEGQAEGHSP